MWSAGCILGEMLTRRSLRQITRSLSLEASLRGQRLAGSGEAEASKKQFKQRFSLKLILFYQLSILNFLS